MQAAIEEPRDRPGPAAGARGARSASRSSPTTARTSRRCSSAPTSRCTRRRTENAGYAFYDAASCGTHDPGRLTLVGELRRALEQRELVAATTSRRPCSPTARSLGRGAAALEPPGARAVGPDDFIPLAQQTGLIKPLTLYVIDEALRQCRAWLEAGERLAIAVNLSTRNLLDIQFPTEVAGAARRVADRRPRCSSSRSPSRRCSPTRCARSRSSSGSRRWASGCRSTTSAPATPRSPTSSGLPVDEIKIDRSFVMGMAPQRGRRDDRALDDRPRPQPRARGRRRGRGDRGRLEPPHVARLHGRAGLLPEPPGAAGGAAGVARGAPRGQAARRARRSGLSAQPAERHAQPGYAPDEMSRRPSAASPTATSSAATAVSATSVPGAALPPGSDGLWLKGERSSDARPAGPAAGRGAATSTAPASASPRDGAERAARARSPRPRGRRGPRPRAAGRAPRRAAAAPARRRRPRGVGDAGARAPVATCTSTPRRRRSRRARPPSAGGRSPWRGRARRGRRSPRRAAAGPTGSRSPRRRARRSTNVVARYGVDDACRRRGRRSRASCALVVEQARASRADRAERAAEEEEPDRPADERAALQAQREADGRRQPRAAAGEPGPRRDEARSRGRAARAARTATASRRRGGGEREQQRPPALAGERARRLAPADRRQPRQRPVADVARRAQDVRDRRARRPPARAPRGALSVICAVTAATAAKTRPPRRTTRPSASEPASGWPMPTSSATATPSRRRGDRGHDEQRRGRAARSGRPPRRATSSAAPASPPRRACSARRAACSSARRRRRRSRRAGTRSGRRSCRARAPGPRSAITAGLPVSVAATLRAVGARSGTGP